MCLTSRRHSPRDPDQDTGKTFQKKTDSLHESAAFCLRAAKRPATIGGALALSWLTFRASSSHLLDDWFAGRCIVRGCIYHSRRVRRAHRTTTPCRPRRLGRRLWPTVDAGPRVSVDRRQARATSRPALRWVARTWCKKRSSMRSGTSPASRGRTQAELLAWLRRILLNHISDANRQLVGRGRQKRSRELSLNGGSSIIGPRPPAADGDSPSRMAMAEEEAHA